MFDSAQEVDMLVILRAGYLRRIHFVRGRLAKGSQTGLST